MVSNIFKKMTIKRQQRRVGFNMAKERDREYEVRGMRYVVCEKRGMREKKNIKSYILGNTLNVVQVESKES